MKRLLRWVGIALGSLVVLAVIAYAVVYGVSERRLRTTYEIPAVSISIPTDPESITEGRRLATIHDCFSGCHGKEAEGAVLFDQPIIAHVVAPNLTAAVRKYSDAELAVAIRHGLRPDGHSMVVMPSEGFILLTDEDLGRIIAFLKSLPAVEGPGPGSSFGPAGRLGFAIGKFKPVAQLIADTVPPPEATTAASRLRAVPCAHYLCSVPRDQPARGLQSRFHQSGSAGRGCLFSGSVHSAATDGRCDRREKTWRDGRGGTKQSVAAYRCGDCRPVQLSARSAGRRSQLTCAHCSDAS